MCVHRAPHSLRPALITTLMIACQKKSLTNSNDALCSYSSVRDIAATIIINLTGVGTVDVHVPAHIATYHARCTTYIRAYTVRKTFSISYLHHAKTKTVPNRYQPVTAVPNIILILAILYSHLTGIDL